MPSAADYVIRPARASDVPELAKLESRCFRLGKMTEAGFLRHLASPRAVILVARGREGHVAGYAMLLLRADSIAARLYGLAVAAPLRRAGIGQRLLRAAERAARQRGAAELRLEVRTSNDAARALYDKLGYTRFGIRREYYADGADALRMARAL